MEQKEKTRKPKNHGWLNKASYKSDLQRPLKRN